MAHAQIRAHAYQADAPLPDTLAAWEQAKDLKTAEEYRLLYVAIIRAKRLIWLSAVQQAPLPRATPTICKWPAPARWCPGYRNDYLICTPHGYPLGGQDC